MFVVAGALLYGISTFIAHRMAEKANHPSLLAIPKRTLYFSSGSTPPIPNARSRTRRIVAYLRSITELVPLPDSQRIYKYALVDYFRTGSENRLLR